MLSNAPFSQTSDPRSASRYADQLARVRQLCLQLVTAGASAAAEPGSCPDLHNRGNSHPVTLALAALRAVREPGLLVFDQLQPQQRRELASGAAALARQLHQDLQAPATPSATTAPEQASGEAPVQGGQQELAAREGASRDLVLCMDVLTSLLRLDAQSVSATEEGCQAAVVRTPGFIPTATAMLQPQPDAIGRGGETDAPAGLTPLQGLALECLECLTHAIAPAAAAATAAAASEVVTLACEQAVGSGAVEALVLLLSAVREPSRVLQVLLRLARGVDQAGQQQGHSHAEQRVVRALVDMCAASGQAQGHFLAAAEAVLRTPAAVTVESDHRLLLEAAAALLEARPEAASSLQGHPLLECTLCCLAAAPADAVERQGPAGGCLRHAALRLLHPLLCSYPQGRPLPMGDPGPLLRGLVRQAAAGGGDGSDGNGGGAACDSCTLALDCLFHCLRVLGTNNAQQCLVSGLGRWAGNVGNW